VEVFCSEVGDGKVGLEVDMNRGSLPPGWQNGIGCHLKGLPMRYSRDSHHSRSTSKRFGDRGKKG